MSLKKQLFLTILIFASTPKSNATDTYQCRKAVDQSFFCESNAESAAEDCAIYLCEAKTGKHCEILDSRSEPPKWPLNLCFGYAIARPISND